MDILLQHRLLCQWEGQSIKKILPQRKWGIICVQNTYWKNKNEKRVEKLILQASTLLSGVCLTVSSIQCQFYNLVKAKGLSSPLFLVADAVGKVHAAMLEGNHNLLVILLCFSARLPSEMPQQCRSVGPPLWFWLKYPRNYWMYCHEIWYSVWCPEAES